MKPLAAAAFALALLAGCEADSSSPPAPPEQSAADETDSDPPPAAEPSPVRTATDAVVREIGGETARVELHLAPAIVTPREAPLLVLVNTGEVFVEHGEPFSLERRTADGWRWANRKQGFRLPIRGLTPGEESRPREIAVYSRRGDPKLLAPGLYRVRKGVRLGAGEPGAVEAVLTARFRVS